MYLIIARRATIFLILSAINTKPSSRLTLFIPRTDIRVKPKIAFINPKQALHQFFFDYRFFVSGSESF